MIKGKIYFYDRHEEDILDYKHVNGLVKVHTNNGDYIYKPTYTSVLDFLESIMPSRRYYEVTNWTQPIYYQKVQTFQEDGSLKDELVKVPILSVKLYTLSEMGVDKDVYLKNLTSIMTAKGITLSDLSQMTGLSKQRLYNYIKGNVKPREQTVDIIADALGVTGYSLSDNSYIGKEKTLISIAAQKERQKELEEKYKIVRQNFERYIQNKFDID